MINDETSIKPATSEPSEPAVHSSDRVRRPQRVQLKRHKGWRMPPNTVSVARPHKWGNPYIVSKDGNAEECVQKFRKLIAGALWLAPGIAELRGKNLACFCKLNRPCHADVLLELANA